MKTKAAIAFEAGKPLEIEMVDLEGPKQGEVLIEMKATGFVIQMLIHCQELILRAHFQQF